MAPVPLEPGVNYVGVTLVAVHVLSIALFIQRVAASLVHSNRTLPVSQDVKERMSKRRQLGGIFLLLAVLSLAVAATTGVRYASLSFKHWASERGLASDPSTFQSAPFNTSTTRDLTTNQSHQFLSDRCRWLGETPLYHDAFEIVAEKARRFWWGQQLELALVPWSVFVAVEGHRRGIANLSAFLALAHLVSFSFAQNAFFIALILTPVPLPKEKLPLTRWSRFSSRISPEKPRNWCLKPGYLLLLAMLSYASIYVLPLVAGSLSFNRVMAMSRGLSFAPLILQALAPPSMGVMLSQKRKADPAFTDLFRFMAAMAVVLHAYATFTGLTFNMPDAHYHRHSKIIPWDIEERSRWERTTTAAGKLVGAMRDHPVVAGVVWDVLISSLSLSIWATIRPLGAGDVLSAVVPLYDQEGDASDAPDQTPDDERQLSHEINEIDEPSTLAMRGGAKPRKKGTTSESKGKKAVTATPEEAPTETPVTRRRGRPRKVKELQLEEQDPIEGVGHQPGEEEKQRDPIEEPGDETYDPTPEEKASAALLDPPVQGLDTEAGALVWGLIAIGGLALGSAGVLGGELLI